MHEEWLKAKYCSLWIVTVTSSLWTSQVELNTCLNDSYLDNWKNFDLGIAKLTRIGTACEKYVLLHVHDDCRVH